MHSMNPIFKFQQRNNPSTYNEKCVFLLLFQKKKLVMNEINTLQYSILDNFVYYTQSPIHKYNTR